MNSEVLNELKMKTRGTSLRNRFSSSGNLPEYLELDIVNFDHIDIEKNNEPTNYFNFPPPPPMLLNEIPQELAEDYNHDLNNFRRSINYKLYCFGFFIISLISGMAVLYKYYII